VLAIAEHAAGFGTGAGPNREAFVKDMLGVAGVRDIKRLDIFACGWPADVALEIARVVFRASPLARLRFEHLKSKSSALQAFETVRAAPFALLGRYPSAQSRAWPALRRSPSGRRLRATL